MKRGAGGEVRGGSESESVVESAPMALLSHAVRWGERRGITDPKEEMKGNRDAARAERRSGETTMTDGPFTARRSKDSVSDRTSPPDRDTTRLTSRVMRISAKGIGSKL